MERNRGHDVRMTPAPLDRVLDWRDELLRIEARLGELPQAARVAVLEVVYGFLAEDCPDPERRAA